jgi:hypothetical protein
MVIQLQLPVDLLVLGRLRVADWLRAVRVPDERCHREAYSCLGRIAAAQIRDATDPTGACSDR